MNGQDLAAADIAAQIREIDSGTAEEWRVGSGRSAIVWPSHMCSPKGTESLRGCAETRLTGRRTRPPIRGRVFGAATKGAGLCPAVVVAG